MKVPKRIVIIFNRAFRRKAFPIFPEQRITRYEASIPLLNGKLCVMKSFPVYETDADGRIRKTGTISYAKARGLDGNWYQYGNHDYQLAKRELQTELIHRELW